jgi:hypothetical protein
MSGTALRVAFVRLGATALFRKDEPAVFGGAEVRAWTFARGLAADSAFDVQMILHGPPSRVPEVRDRVHLRRVLLRRRSADRCWGPKLLWQVPQDTLASWTHSLRTRCAREPLAAAPLRKLPVDVLATFGLQDPSAAVIQSARRSGVRSVLFLTSDLDTQQALDPTLARNHPTLARHRFAILHADLIVAQTELQRSCVAPLGRPVVQIRNPLDTRLPAGQPLSMMARKYVLWVGRADTDCKRADLCWELARACPQVPFVAVMNPQAPGVTAQLKMAAPANVRLIEHVAWEASDALYREALLLVNTSESEGFPNAFLQAAKHGVPILSRRVDPDGILRRERMGFVADDQLDRLAELIRQAAASPEQFEAPAAAARRYVTTHHEAVDRVVELKRVLAGS